MLASIFRNRLAWSLKQHYFTSWRKKTRTRRDKLLAIRHSLQQALRDRMLNRIQPAFQFWRQIARYKHMEHTPVPLFLLPIAQFSLHWNTLCPKTCLLHHSKWQVHAFIPCVRRDM
jgi:hypothetical protein